MDRLKSRLKEMGFIAATADLRDADATGALAAWDDFAGTGRFVCAHGGEPFKAVRQMKGRPPCP